MLHDDKQKKTNAPSANLDNEVQSDENEKDSIGIEQRVDQLTNALAPVLLPMIESLGALDLDAEFAELVGSVSDSGD